MSPLQKMVVPSPPPASLLRKHPHPEETSLPTPKRWCPVFPSRGVHDGDGVLDRVKVLAHLRAAHGMDFLHDDWMLSALAHGPAAATAVPLPDQVTPTAADVTPEVVKQHVPRLRLELGSFYMPKEGKNPRGEDAHFVSKALDAFGIADGVGGWTRHGIDPGEFARQLMSFCEDELEVASYCSTTGAVLEGVLEKALARTTARGTSTACIAVVDGRRLHTVNMGDSGFLVVRGDKVVYHSPSQQGSFNRPYQIGRVDRGDPPELANRISVEIEPGDIIVAGSDGLFDNLFDAEILDVLETAKVDGQGTPEELARAVGWAAVEAYIVGQETPFSVACREAQISWSGGGKPDDVTVVVASVL